MSLPGSGADGSVSWFQRAEIDPLSPRSPSDSATIPPSGISASATSSATACAVALQQRRRMRGAGEADRKAREGEHDEHDDEQRAELQPGLIAQAERDAVVGQRALRERPGGDGAAACHTADQHRRAALAPWHGGKPERGSERCGEHGAA